MVHIGQKVRGGSFLPSKDLASFSKMYTGNRYSYLLSFFKRFLFLRIMSVCLYMQMEARGRGVLPILTPHYSLETRSLTEYGGILATSKPL